MLSKLRLHKINKNVNNSDLSHISNGFSMFYFDTIRLNVLQVKTKATHLLQHDSPKGAYVHEMTLCVTFGALRFWSSFASWLRSCDLRRRKCHAHEVSWPHRAGSGDRENPKQEGAKWFRPCPCWLALRRVTPSWSKRVGPSEIIVVVVVVVVVVLFY